MPLFFLGDLMTIVKNQHQSSACIVITVSLLPPIASEEEQWLTAITVNGINNTAAGIKNQPHYHHYPCASLPLGAAIETISSSGGGGLANVISLSLRILFFLFVSCFVFFFTTATRISVQTTLILSVQADNTSMHCYLHVVKQIYTILCYRFKKTLTG